MSTRGTGRLRLLCGYAQCRANLGNAQTTNDTLDLAIAERERLSMFFVLTALLGEPLHGYGIVGEVEELSAGRVQLKIGSVYGILDRLVAESYVEFDREEPFQGWLRRCYRITGVGAEALRVEAARQAANVQAATRRMRAVQPRWPEAS